MCGRGGVGLQGFHAFPLLDHDEGVGAEFFLKGGAGVGIDGGGVLDAALLGP